MITTLADAWVNLKSVPNIVGILVGGVTALIAATVALLGAVIAALVSLRNTRKTLDHAKETLEVARASSARAAATFIAEKRQKWIDELRADVAAHLAESQEYLWKWDGARQRAAEVMNDNALPLDDRTTKMKVLALEFSDKNGVIDRSHQERHHRLRFRLNPNEADHLRLRDYLDEIRKIFDDTARIKDRDTAIALIARLETLVAEADTLTNEILKTEWERVKQEVAYPDRMIAKIPPPA